MARTIARVARPQAQYDEEEAAIISLYIAVIRQARRDLSSPLRSRDSTNGSHPSEAEKQTAAEFLEALYAAASRRQGIR